MRGMLTINEVTKKEQHETKKAWAEERQRALRLYLQISAIPHLKRRLRRRKAIRSRLILMGPFPPFMGR